MNGKTGMLGQYGHYLFLCATSLLIWPTIAHAHLVNTGFGPLYDGVTHLAMSPDDLLSVLAIALLSGLVGKRHGRAVLFTLSTAWMIGGLLGLQIEREVSLTFVKIISLLLVGAMVAADRKLPLMLVSGLALGLGLLNGFLNGTAMAQAGGGTLALVGIAMAVFVIVALTVAVVVSLRKAWMRIAVRVAGSWIAAIGLLMLGWVFRGMN